MSYADDQTSAASLIAEAGQAVTLTYHAAGAYDLTTDTVTATDTTASTSGVVLPLSRGLKNMAGTTVQADDQQLLLPGSITQPTIGTSVLIGSKAYSIVEVAPLNPGGTALIYDCVIRGAP